MTKRNVTIIIKGDNFGFNANISPENANYLIGEIFRLANDKSDKSESKIDISKNKIKFNLLKSNFEKIAIVVCDLFDKLSRPISIKEIEQNLLLNGIKSSNLYRDLTYAQNKNLVMKPDSSRHHYLPTENARSLYETVR